MAYCPECRAEFEHSTKCSWHPNRELHRELATARAEVARLTRERDTTVELVATASRVLDTERAKVSALQEQNDLMRKKLNCMSDCGECHFCLAARLGSANEKIVAYSTANTELRVMIAHGPSAVALAAMKAAHEALTENVHPSCLANMGRPCSVWAVMDGGTFARAACDRDRAALAALAPWVNS